jgi:hypothetical protein
LWLYALYLQVTEIEFHRTDLLESASASLVGRNTSAEIRCRIAKAVALA